MNAHLATNIFILTCLFFFSFLKRYTIGGGWGVQLFVLNSNLNSRPGSVSSSENKSRFKKRLRTMEMTTGSQRKVPPEQLVKESYHWGFEVDFLCVFSGIPPPLENAFSVWAFSYLLIHFSKAEARIVSHTQLTARLQAWNLGSFNHTHPCVTSNQKWATWQGKDCRKSFLFVFVKVTA